MIFQIYSSQCPWTLMYTGCGFWYGMTLKQCKGGAKTARRYTDLTRVGCGLFV